MIATNHGDVTLSIFEEGVPPVFRLAFAENGTPRPAASDVSIETARPGDARQTFAFAQKEGFLESTTAIPEPHEFELTLSIAQAGQVHRYQQAFREHEHDHDDAAEQAELVGGAEFQDAHELEHAAEIQERFANRTVTTPQIVLFGLTGGLMPCPAAFTVLLVCLQVKQFTLGFALVGAFSFGLAVTMVTVGAVAAWSVGHAQKKFRGFGEAMRKAPYVSFALLVLLACYMAWQGFRGLHAVGH